MQIIIRFHILEILPEIQSVASKTLLTNALLNASTL